MHTMEYNPESWVQKRAPEQAGLALAMAYVPIQPWEKPYEADVGLVRGTIFPSLDKPFIGEGPAVMDERTQWMRALQMYGLALFDLHLFLDTHPTDQNALAYYTNYQTLYAQTMAAYVAKYGPIEASQYNGSGTWQWIDSPWPWEN